MGYREDNQYMIYPLYFDKNCTRKEGRRLSLKDAVEKPSIEDIAKAAKSLGYNPTVEREIAHPSRNWKKEGRILINKKHSKQQILSQISNLL